MDVVAKINETIGSCSVFYFVSIKLLSQLNVLSIDLIVRDALLSRVQLPHASDLHQRLLVIRQPFLRK